MSENTIYTVNAIIIRDRKILIVKDNDKYVLPGGRIEGEETDMETLIREMYEELSIDIAKCDVSLIKYFDFEKAYKSDRPLQMRVYLVNTDQKPVINDNEITDILWLDTDSYKDRDDLPKPWFDVIFAELKSRNLIDLT